MVEDKLIKRNILSSLFSQIVMIICGFIVPKTILFVFGSETNGLISSISQILNYVTLLEGGVSGVIAAALYKPLAQQDNKKINAIVNASKKFFFQLGVIYSAYSISIGLIYPLVKNTPFSYGYIFSLTMILACSLTMQYFFSISYSILLKADRKVYIYYNVHTISVILNAFLVIIAARFFKDILIVKAVTACVYALNPIFFSYYVHKHYQLDDNIEPDKTAISQRWDGFGQTLAYFIHSNTDIVVLTFCSTLSIVSVYSVYILIISALKNVMSAISSSIIPSIGKLYGNGDIESVRNSYYQYEYGFSLISLIIFSCCMGLIVPFVSIYTKGIQDVNYIQPFFGYLMVLAELVYCFRDPSTSLIYAAGHFKQTAKFAYAEACINIIISLVLVKRYELIGVAAGTLFAMMLRWFLHMFYLKRNIIYISVKNTARNICIFVFDICTLIIIYRQLIPNTMDNYYEWIKFSILILFITILIIAITNYLFNRDKFLSFVKICIKATDKTIKISDKRN